MIRALLELILCFGTAFVANCHAQDQQCYSGSLKDGDVDIRHLKVVDCANGRAADFKMNLTEAAMPHCVVQTHVGKSELNSLEFRCDNDNLCATESSSVKGDNGSVYCCKKSLCNLPSLTGITDGASASNINCFVGSVTNNNTAVTNVKCGTSSQQCLSYKRLDANGNPASSVGMTFECDDGKKCRQNGLTSSCKNVTIDSSPQEMCCCTLSNCNNPKYVISGRQPMGTLTPGDFDNTHSNWMYIGGVLSATLVAVLVTAGLVIVIRKCQQRRDEHVRYIYSQLTADLSEEIDDDDAYMIVA